VALPRVGYTSLYNSGKICRPLEGPWCAESEEKREPVSDIDPVSARAACPFNFDAPN